MSNCLPDDLKAGIKTLLNKMPKGVVVKAAADLSNRYRSKGRDTIVDFMNSEAHRLAYLAVRMPATYAVVCRVLQECKDRMPDFIPETLADIGAGPGTASWAAIEVFPEIKRLALYERDRDLAKIGSSLMQSSSQRVFKKASWSAVDLLETINIAKCDMMVLSYVIGELPISIARQIIKSVWETTGKVLVIIEPGTPHGFSRIVELRSLLIDLGAHLVAPCPHHRACPMQGGDWCHFACRLERSSLHREVKDVEMGYEDEKYSYVVASKDPVTLPEARVLRHPQGHSGHVDFVLCSQTGLEKRVISKRMGDTYKRARKLSWGDVI